MNAEAFAPPRRQNSPPERPLLRAQEVIRLTRMSRSTFYRMVQEGRFPRPIHVGARLSAWFEDEVQAWLEARIAARDTPPG